MKNSGYGGLGILIRTIFIAGLVLVVSGAMALDVAAGHARQSADWDLETCAMEVQRRIGNSIERDGPQAQYELASRLYDTECGLQSPDLVVVLLEHAAMRGHVESAYLAARILLEQKQTPETTVRAIELLEIAAERGHLHAQHLAGVLRIANAANAMQRDQGLLWLGSAADRDEGLSAVSLGMIFEQGLHGIATDICLALDWYQVAELSGMPLGTRLAKRIRAEHRDEC